MDVQFRDKKYSFRPWHPDYGRVFDSLFAFDCETTLIDEERFWIAPAYVLGAAFDGVQGFFLLRDRAEEFFAVHKSTPFALHNAAFDLAVLYVLAPDLDIYGWVDGDLVWDTQLLHRLYMLGTQGHSAGQKGESTLDYCVRHYLGEDLPKDMIDSEGKFVRLSYDRWLSRPPQDIEPVYLEYLAKDVIATFRLQEELQHRLHDLLDDSQHVWGFVSDEWLTEQVQRWGPQTHHIQLRASIVLREITAKGLHLDDQRRQQLVEELELLRDKKRKALVKRGYMPGEKGCSKALQGILRRLEYDHPEMYFPRTDTGLYATSREALQDLGGIVPFVKLLSEFRETDKLLNSFVNKMNRRVLHPSFNVLARTGRTTSFGQINAQNLPTDDRVRSCFVPSPSHVFIDADYKTIELATLAQACHGQFGFESEMAKSINAGKDLHTLVAAQVTGKPEDDVTAKERKNAKPINFGKPGGMGDQTLKAYAKTSYGIVLTDEEVEALSRAWFQLFPEMESFLGDTADIGMEIARLFQLTLASHIDFTGDVRFIRHSENEDHVHRPYEIFGGMLLKALATSEPQTRSGKLYPQTDLDYFWSQVQGQLQ